MILGANEQDYVKLKNKNYTVFDMNAGQFDVFVRTDQADPPYIQTVEQKPNERTCLKAFPRPSRAATMFIPLSGHFISLFNLEESACPSASKLSGYKKVSIRY